MQYLFSRACGHVLAGLAEKRTLCAFDYDGTLAPIVSEPEQASMRNMTRELLVNLTALYPCVILSGRARADLLAKLEGVNVAQAVGNHGAETGESDQKTLDQVQGWKAALEGQLGSVPGVWVEDKGLSLAVHYRQSPHKREARQRIISATQEFENVRVLGGKRVVNLMAADAPHKGNALLVEMERLRCDWALYIGDDENDEDVFALRDNVISVRVGRKETSLASYYLRRQDEIDELMKRLVTLRTL